MISYLDWRCTILHFQIWQSAKTSTLLCEWLINFQSTVYRRIIASISLFYRRFHVKYSDDQYYLGSKVHTLQVALTMPGSQVEPFEFPSCSTSKKKINSERFSPRTAIIWKNPEKNLQSWSPPDHFKGLSQPLVRHNNIIQKHFNLSGSCIRRT